MAAVIVVATADINWPACQIAKSAVSFCCLCVRFIAFGQVNFESVA